MSIGHRDCVRDKLIRTGLLMNSLDTIAKVFSQSGASNVSEWEAK
jgi:hypothetical protein